MLNERLLEVVRALAHTAQRARGRVAVGGLTTSVPSAVRARRVLQTRRACTLQVSLLTSLAFTVNRCFFSTIVSRFLAVWLAGASIRFAFLVLIQRRQPKLSRAITDQSETTSWKPSMISTDTLMLPCSPMTVPKKRAVRRVSALSPSAGSPSAESAPTALDSLFTELRPPPPADHEDVPELPRVLHLIDIVLCIDGPGLVLASFIASRGDVVRMRAASKSLRFACDRSWPFKYLGLFRPSLGALPTSVLQPHQFGSLRTLSAAEDPPGWQFGQLRGGILADDPGLGKTGGRFSRPRPRPRTHPHLTPRAQ